MSIAILLLVAQLAASSIITFTWASGTGLIRLAAKGKPGVNILVDPDEHDGVTRAAADLALDFGRVTGINGSVSEIKSGDTFDNGNAGVIIVGTIGKSTIIDDLVSEGKVSIEIIDGKWESYVHQVVRNPIDGVSEALIIAGSDKRGSIYGIYSISETIGVSPWYWWSDVPPKKKAYIYAGSTKTTTQGPPSVKYRGLFINDEAQLIAWAKGKFSRSPRKGYFTSGFYARVFELLLRLKANCLWPGMTRTEAFYLDDKLNGEIADNYGIVMGTSHHEPMARAYNEQLELLDGAWDWSTNKANITAFMKEGVNRTKSWEHMFTMGMRGDGDRESPTLTASQLEEIILVQQEMIEEYLNTPIEDVPQTWALYKEVGKYWEEGMDISEQVTLMWTDDNFGNLNRIPLENETDRAGGAGIYYHFGYVGDPRNYEWINTIQLVKTWEQMHLAYQKGAKNIWIANCQDIKGFEVPWTHFLDMAYDMSKYETPDSTTEWLKRWAKREFGHGTEDAVAKICNTYGKLILRRKYETLTMKPFAWSTLNYDEAQGVLEEWNELAKLAQTTYDQLDTSTQPAFYQLVLYPIKAGNYVIELYIKAALGSLYKSQQRTSTNTLALEARAAFDNDALMTSGYHSLLNSKWNYVMSGKHIGYSGRNPPNRNILPTLSYVSDEDAPESGILGVAIQGSKVSSTQVTDKLVLIPVDRYPPKDETRYLDIFTTRNGTFSYSIKANVSYVSISDSSGTLSTTENVTDARSVVKVNWSKAPTGFSWVGLNISRTDDGGDDEVVTAVLPVNKTSVPSKFTGYIESNGIVSIEAAHFSEATKTDDASYVEIPYYGKTSSGVKLWPVTLGSQDSSSGPKLTYHFYTFSDISDARLIVILGASLNHDPTRPLKLSFSLDDGDVTTERVLADYAAGSHPTDWNTAVIKGGWNVTSEIAVMKGAHSLDLWLHEPGVVVEKLVVDLGGWKDSGLGPPESKYVES